MVHIFAFHGNPGQPQDWNNLRQTLSQTNTESNLLTPHLDDSSWIKEFEAASSPVILIGHSYGCYHLLKHLQHFDTHQLKKVEKVILVNPYVFPERTLSGLVCALLQAPILGPWLMKSNHKKSHAAFFQTLIHPFQKSATPIYLEVEKNIANPETWVRTIQRKIAMQADPLSLPNLQTWFQQIPSTVEFHVLWGEQDQISTESAQAPMWSPHPRIKVTRLADSGHGILWSHPKAIAEIIHQKKIGYFPGQDTRNNVITYMEKHLQNFPERLALKWVPREALAQWSGRHDANLKHVSISYKDFSQRINTVAKGLLDIGIKAGDRVIIFLPMSLDMYTSMFAVQRIGAIAVFLDSWARSHHLGASAECVSPKAMISFKQAFELVDQVPEFKSMPIRILYGPGEKFTHHFEQLLKAEGVAPIAPVESESTALITFTTGSTGKPKGANRTHRFLSAQHHALDHVIPYSAADQDMPAFPIFSLNNLAGGVTTILPAIDLSAPAPHDGALLACQILSEKSTCTTLSPSQLNNLTKYCSENHIQLSGLRRVVTGGAPISKDDVAHFYQVAPQAELWILYGSTEAEPMAHIEGRQMLESSKKALTDPEVLEEGVNVGHISEDIDYKFIRLIDGPIHWQDHKRWESLEVAKGEVGEFICTGDHVCREYYNNPDAFAATKIMDSEQRVWHRTGDLAYIDSEKQLWIVGRVNNAIIRKKKYHFPVRAEVLLKRFSFVKKAAFLGMPDSVLGEANWACIELNEEALKAVSYTYAEARKEIERVFLKNDIPLDRVAFVQGVPMDPRHHSKVEYKVLRDQLQNQKDFIID